MLEIKFKNKIEQYWTHKKKRLSSESLSIVWILNNLSDDSANGLGKELLKKQGYDNISISTK